MSYFVRVQTFIPINQAENLTLTQSVSCVPETVSEIVKELEARFLSVSYGLVVQALSPKKGK